jgi:hypothetical protein
MEVFFILRNDTPQKFGSPAPLSVKRLRQQNYQRLEYTPAPPILQATAERERLSPRQQIISRSTNFVQAQTGKS